MHLLLVDILPAFEQLLRNVPVVCFAHSDVEVDADCVLVSTHFPGIRILYSSSIRILVVGVGSCSTRTQVFKWVCNPQ